MGGWRTRKTFRNSEDEFRKDLSLSYDDGSYAKTTQRGYWRDESSFDSFSSSERAYSEAQQYRFERLKGDGLWSETLEATKEAEEPEGFDIPVKAVAVKEGRYPGSHQLVGVDPAIWIGDSLKGTGFKFNTATPEDENARIPDLPEFLKHGAAIPPLSNCQVDLMLKLSAYYETGEPDLYYERCEMVDRHHGLAAGYIDLTSNQGSLERVIKRYTETIATGIENPFKKWMELLAERSSGFANLDNIAQFDGFCDTWRKVSKEKAFRKAYDSAVVDLYITPTLAAAKALNLTQPLSITILFDSMVHLGHKLLDSQIIPNITGETTAMPRVQDPIRRESVYISKLILMRQVYRTKSDEARKKAIQEENFQYERDTSPDGVWEKGLAAYASLVVANGKERDGILRSLAMKQKRLIFAADVEGTTFATATCDRPLKEPVLRAGALRASDPDLNGKPEEEDREKKLKPVGTWQKKGKIINGAGALTGSASMGLAAAVGLVALMA
ncbi:hypothetical protein HDU97_004407 [Phlyctochytrium planicorne]|nr:hypothetical protein HDU97_004407 [Phlyctochytrium planicorne]